MSPVVGWEIIDPVYYGRYGYPHASWAWLRRHSPVAWSEAPGIPREDWPYMFRLSNTLLGAADPEYQQGATLAETAERARQEFVQYFGRLSAARRREPRDDFITTLATAQIDGRPIPEWELLSYYVLLIVAG